MKGYNLPDNVSSSDPEAPWNKKEREEENEEYSPDSEEEENSEEDDLLALLYEVEADLKQNIQNAGFMYTESWATVHCQCGRTYTGLMTHVLGMDNLYDNYQSRWCPNCLQDHAAEWWRNCFRMEQVKTVQNTNRLEEN